MTPIPCGAGSALKHLPRRKRNLFELIGKKVSAEEASFEAIKLACPLSLTYVIVPLQDILGLGAEARMNNPSQPSGNWQWRVTTDQLDSDKFGKLGYLTVNYLRC